MVTIPHTDTDNGYSLRISKNLPPNSANLAYVKSDTPSQEKNLLIEDKIKDIAENKLNTENFNNFSVFSKNDMQLETESGINLFPRNNIDLTDEYSSLDNNEALFYKSFTKYSFDARYSKVNVYINGNTVSQEKRFEELKEIEKNNLIYNDNKIYITKENGIPLNENEKYKIKLTRIENNIYRIIIYVNFNIYENIYEIHYPAYELKNKETNQILNFSNVFELIDFNELNSMSNEEKLINKVYSIVGDNKNGYKVYAPNPTIELNDINESSRPSHNFKYHIEANLSTRISDRNTAEIKVGLIYINETAFNQRNISSSAKKLFSNNNFFPKYMSFSNPHTQFGMNIKEQYEYWLADINMPIEHYLDYDILIISGYGDKNFNKYESYFRQFLDNGGLMIYDNCGTGLNTLNSISNNSNTFINNISFSKTENNNNRREYNDIKNFKERYYLLNNASTIGEVSPVINFNGKENINDWKIYINHQSQGPSVIAKEKEYNGNLIISNAGLMLDVLMGNNESINFLTNLIIYYSENKYFKTPKIKEYVYHKDNLFKKEYIQENKILYIEDKSDLDDTQIVAKKILDNSVKNKMKNYLPSHFKNATGNYLPRVNNSGFFELENSSFEKTNTNGIVEWTKSTEEAIPGWNTEMLAGSTSMFKQTTDKSKDGYYSTYIKTNNAQSSWTQNLGVIQAGIYQFNIWIYNNLDTEFTYAIYDNTGTLLFESEEINFKGIWKEYSLPFELKTNKELILKIGSHKENKTIEAYLDNVELKSENTIRMNLKNNGNENLYAYATSPKGEGLNIAYNNLKEDNILKENINLNAELLIKSYVYQWNNAEAVYKKKYGNVSSHIFNIKNSDEIKVIDKLLTLIPPLNDGIEWADKTRVYYEIELKNSVTSELINLEIYDPSIDTFYYTSEGVSAINYNDLWWNSWESTVVVRASTSFYGLKVTGRYYNLLVNPDIQIQIEAPKTIDERDKWFLRIKNGSFQKKSISFKELEELKEIGYENYYEDKLIGVHEYSIPEYQKQTFFPRYGEREILLEKAEYVNNNKIKIQRNPLIIKEEYIEKEMLLSGNPERTIFTSSSNWWNKERQPIIYWDELNDGTDTILNGGYTIDYDLGIITMDNPIATGTIKATYWQQNFKIIKRKFKNEKILKESLTTRDGFTFHVSNKKIANFPQPIIYKNDIAIHPQEAKIDYENGTITFFDRVETRVYLDYNYFIDEELDYKDVSILTGEIILNKEINFKDEIYVSYLYKENFYEYKGFYDEDNKVFMSLDLNPTVGHTYIEKEMINDTVSFINKPTEKLLGKDIFIYLLPSKSIYNIEIRTNENCLRHVFSEEEWNKTKQSYPEALLVSKIQIRENTIIENTILMDARKRGGGLKESISNKTIEEKTGYTSNYWDINSFDGIPFYKNAVNIIKLPASILKKNGGTFTEEDVENAISKYLAYGTFPIIEYLEET